MGETQYVGAQAFADIRREGELEPLADGAVSDSGLVWGTYVHGLFDDDSFRHAFIDDARAQCGLQPAERKIPIAGQREDRMNRWADHLRQSLNMDLIRDFIWKTA